jgi:hypothetical protein
MKKASLIESGHYPEWTAIGDPHGTVMLRKGAVVQIKTVPETGKALRGADQDGYNVGAGGDDDDESKRDETDYVCIAPNKKLIVVKRHQIQIIKENT